VIQVPAAADLDPAGDGLAGICRPDLDLLDLDTGDVPADLPAPRP
jgi:hypothetical protein